MDRTPKLDGSALGLSVDARGNAWLAVAHGVRSEVDSFQNNSLATAYTWPEGTVDSLASPQIASAPDVRVLTVADPQHADNLAIPHENTLQRITNEGEEQLAKVALGEVRVEWTSKEGIALEGIVTFPSNYERGKAFPFLWHHGLAHIHVDERLAAD